VWDGYDIILCYPLAGDFLFLDLCMMNVYLNVLFNVHGCNKQLIPVFYFEIRSCLLEYFINVFCFTEMSLKFWQFTF